MDAEEFKRRTKLFALAIIRLVQTLPPGVVTGVIGRQLTKSGTSVAANYRAACRARSRADFVAKMGVVEEEVDESILWMEVLVESGCLTADQTRALTLEANELLAMAVTSIRTARAAKD